MAVYYLGQFPPPYGGVTVKNALLYEALSERLPIMRIGFRDESISKIFRLVLTSRHDFFIIGFGNAKLQRLFICLLACIKPSVLTRCCLIAMGGLLPSRLSNDVKYRKACSRIRCIYVETKGMADEMVALGLKNASVYPNCRRRPLTASSPKTVEGKPKCVFFSQIGPAKGADIVLEAAEHLCDIEFHFYGQIRNNFEEAFISRVSELPNVFYHGVFDTVNNDVIKELSQYDLHVFPTKWAAEGVPGVLVETKIAAVPSIVSNMNYNTELIDSEKDGIVLEECTSNELCQVIKVLFTDANLLYSMKEAALASAEDYYVDQYIDLLIADLKEA